MTITPVNINSQAIEAIVNAVIYACRVQEQQPMLKPSVELARRKNAGVL